MTFIPLAAPHLAEPARTCGCIALSATHTAEATTSSAWQVTEHPLVLQSAAPRLTTRRADAGPPGPCAPGGPASPLSPFGPFGPSGPGGPAGPAMPAGPRSPVSPLGPCGPCAPAGPATPAGPGAPRSPFAPCGPVAPGGPAGPAEPCGPSKHPAKRKAAATSAADVNRRMVFFLPLFCPDVHTGLLLNASAVCFAQA
jgi:hypothetical protein